jgi:hypothetical protein
MLSQIESLNIEYVFAAERQGHGDKLKHILLLENKKGLPG